MLFITHPLCLQHQTNDGHPESPARLAGILAAVANLPDLVRHLAVAATREDILLAHSAQHYERVMAAIPTWGLNFIDADTVVSPESGEAALHAAGAVMQAVSLIAAGDDQRAFCAVRPPGHHAHREKAHGFCLFNNVAIGALAAQQRYGMPRVAVVDIDVHHGDGTQQILWDNPEALFISVHQEGIFPGTGVAHETGAHDNVLNIPLRAGANGMRFQRDVMPVILSRLQVFKPNMIFVSAGYDGHAQDPLGGFALETHDYAQLMQQFCHAADTLCDGKLVAVLEGGYDLDALADSVMATVQGMTL